jgi:protein-tyrosine-phosphatase
MAEAITNQLFSVRFQAFSAGSKPDPEKNPETKGVHLLAVKTLNKNNIRTEQLYSKNWDSFIQSAENLDFVFTLCGDALNDINEACPVFPGQPMSAHWGIADPVKVTGTQEEVDRAFQDAFLIIRRRIELFASLPLEALEKHSLQKKLDEIGRG